VEGGFFKKKYTLYLPMNSAGNIVPKKIPSIKPRKAFLSIVLSFSLRCRRISSST